MKEIVVNVEGRVEKAGYTQQKEKLIR